MSNIGKVALRKKPEPETPQAEAPVYALVLEKRGGGLALVEVEVPRSACKVLREWAPDAVDQSIARVVGAIEKRFLR
jgi:hypothetical protein